MDAITSSVKQIKQVRELIHICIKRLDIHAFQTNYSNVQLTRTLRQSFSVVNVIFNTLFYRMRPMHLNELGNQSTLYEISVIVKRFMHIRR